MKLTLNKYKKILLLAKKYNLSKFELITNYGLFCGDLNLYKTLKIFELIMSTARLKGDIIELGLWKGNNSLLIKKIIDIWKIKKKLYLLDHFLGLNHFSKNDKASRKRYYLSFQSSKNFLIDFLKFFNFKNYKIIDKDATTLNENFFKNKKFCFVYFDMDLYEPTIRALESIKNNVVKNGIIVFDQGTVKAWGEKYAIQEFLKKNPNFKKILITKKHQPDVMLKKIKD